MAEGQAQEACEPHGRLKFGASKLMRQLLQRRVGLRTPVELPSSFVNRVLHAAAAQRERGPAGDAYVPLTSARISNRLNRRQTFNVSPRKPLEA